jgi:hypothetical protein
MVTERPIDGEALAQRMERVARRANIALLLGLVGLAAAVGALIAPYSPTLRSAIERAVPVKSPEPEQVGPPWDITADDLLREAGLVVSAQEFVLRDRQRRTRATLTVGEDDVVRLSFFDEKGRMHMGLAATTTGGALGFGGSDDQHLAAVLSGDDDGPHLLFFDRDGNPRLSLETKDDRTRLYLGAEGKRQHSRSDLR